jgi:hypothetical protein
MFKWIKKQFTKKREEKIERWKVEAKRRNARYLVITFDSWDKFERPVFDMSSTSAIEACIKATPYNSTKYTVDAFRMWEPEEEKETVECPKCGELVEIE